MSDFEKRIRCAMIMNDMKMTQLAKLLGISVSYTFELIKGTRQNDSIVSQMCEILGLNETDIQ